MSTILQYRANDGANNTEPGEHTMEKKPYTPPKITEHGDAVKQTTGFGGANWETMSPRYGSDVEIKW